MKNMMQIIRTLTLDQWLTVAGILMPLFVALLVYLYNIASKPRNSSFYDELDSKFIELNHQIKVSNFLDKKGRISLKRILNAHKKLFKEPYLQPGKLRTSEVEIVSVALSKVGGSKVGTRVVDTCEGLGNHMASNIPSGKTSLYSKNDVKDALKNAIAKWNRYAPKKSVLTYKSKIEMVARFHTYFEIIHPFTDGNGRIGRMLMSEQLSYLFDKVVEFNPELTEYYEAIALAARGDESRLKDLIVKEVSDGYG